MAGHRLLYARSTRNGFGIVEGGRGFLELLRERGRSGGVVGRVLGGSLLEPMPAGSAMSSPDINMPATTNTTMPTPMPNANTNRIKPAVYTYVISALDSTFRFSETGAAFFVDFASKHALHANCAISVVYSGEFHPRPRIRSSCPTAANGDENEISSGWDAFHDDLSDDEVDWELVIDNNSGTYSPSSSLLPTLKALLEFNFPGLNVVAYDHSNPELAKSTEACRSYAVERRGVKREELMPCVGVGEETLSRVAKGAGPVVDVDGGDVEETMEGMPVQEGMRMPEEVEMEMERW